MPVARVTLQRTLVRGQQCPHNTGRQQEMLHSPSSFVDLSQNHHRNDRFKQKYDSAGQLMYAYGRNK
jgi:hypothetical protein